MPLDPAKSVVDQIPHGEHLHWTDQLAGKLLHPDHEEEFLRERALLRKQQADAEARRVAESQSSGG